MLKYTAETYNAHGYVKVTAKEMADYGPDAAIYYAPMPDALLVTLNEGVLKRAMDRRDAAASQPAGGGGKDAAAAKGVVGWLGETFAGSVHIPFVRMLMRFSAEDEKAEIRRKAWRQLMVLDEIKRLRPGEDAMKVYAANFSEEPADPAGGKISFDAGTGRYGSSVAGNPLSPKEVEGGRAFLEGFDELRFGLTVSENNLRARAVLGRGEERVKDK